MVNAHSGNAGCKGWPAFAGMTSEVDYMKKTIPLIVMLLLAVVALSACGGETSTQDTDGAEATGDSSEYYDLEYHRGGRDARAENTLHAYQYALEHGATSIECDMQLTADNKLVMGHNSALNPDITTDADGNRVEADKYYVHDMTVKELKKYNVGRMDESCEYYDLHGRGQVMADAAIPTLREFFQLVKDSGNDFTRLSIEAKYMSDPAAGVLFEKNPDKDKMLKKFLKLVREFGFEDRVVLQCFDWDVLQRMQRMDPEIETCALYSEEPAWGTADAATLWLDKDTPSPWLGGIDIHDFDGDPIKAAHSLDFDSVSPYWEELTPELVDEAHDFGMKVVPWTINYVEDMEVMYEMGVDGVITDRPWVLEEYLASKGEVFGPESTIDLPYHLETDHLDIPDEKVEGGMDAAY